MAREETRFGTFEELMENVVEPLKTISRKLRDLVYDIDPHTTEVTRMGDGATTFGIGERKMKEGYCYILPHKQWVNFGFFQGSALPDPEQLLEGTGAKMRHIKIRNLEMIENPAIRKLVEAAIEERRTTNA